MFRDHAARFPSPELLILPVAQDVKCWAKGMVSLELLEDGYWEQMLT